MAFNDYAQTEREVIASKGKWMGGLWRGGYNQYNALRGQESMARILDQGFNGVVRPGRGTNMMVGSAVQHALDVQNVVQNSVSPTVISRGSQKASRAAYMNERVSTGFGNPGFNRGIKKIDHVAQLMEQHGLDRESAEAMHFAKVNASKAQSASEASSQFTGRSGKIWSGLHKSREWSGGGPRARIGADSIGSRFTRRFGADALGEGRTGKVIQGLGSIWREANFTKALFNRPMAAGAVGVGLGLAAGGLGNMLAPNLMTTDDHYVKNAIKIGATAGALSMVPRAIVGAKSINPSIPKWAVTGAERLTKSIEKRPGVVGLAFMAAGVMGAMESHFTQAMNGNNRN